MLLFSFSLTVFSFLVILLLLSYLFDFETLVDSVLGRFLFPCSLCSLGGLNQPQDLKYHLHISVSQMCAFHPDPPGEDRLILLRL